NQRNPLWRKGLAALLYFLSDKVGIITCLFETKQLYHKIFFRFIHIQLDTFHTTILSNGTFSRSIY
ncbi:hypothetical protein, partial [Streptococcus pseudopneumoniae]|uniref:hypothetical protein n=1 Tax=Streptococcus pseudopneumoniae TaxID=257758 RepID=UPI000B107D5A